MQEVMFCIVQQYNVWNGIGIEFFKFVFDFGYVEQVGSGEQEQGNGCDQNYQQ